MLKCCHNASPASANKILAFFHYLGWNNIIVMKSWHLNPYSFNAISTDKADLGAFLAEGGGFGKFKTNNPLYLRFQIRIRCVQQHI